MIALYKRLRGRKGGRARQTSYGMSQSRQLNEDEAPENQETEADYQLGVGSDLKPLNGSPIPPEGIKEKDLLP